MKFVIPQHESDRKVDLSLVLDDDGDVSLRANAKTVLWLKRDGTILFNSANADDLENLGFRIRHGAVEH